jgi:urease subunit gamma/beta
MSWHHDGMHLTPREQERLLLAAAADLARRRLARGSPLGATEAVALVCDEICELAWDGVALATVIERARAVIPVAALLPGVASLVPVIEVEALFPWGSTLVHVDAPFSDGHQQNPEDERPVAPPGAAGSPSPAANADATAAAAGQVPAAAGNRALAPSATVTGPGEVHAAAGQIALAPGAPRRTVLLRNTGERDVWISSHFPLDQVNPAVEIRFTGDAKTPYVPYSELDRDGETAAGRVAGCRLALPAGESLLLRPGEERSATVVVVSGGQA